MVQFTIYSQLPSLNDYINVLKSPNGKFTGSKFKNTTDEIICYQINGEIKQRLREQCKQPVIIHFEWHEKAKRRDVDNVYSAKKYILDALQKLGILKNDNPSWVKDVKDSIVYCSRDYVIVRVFRLDELELLKQFVNNDIERWDRI